jgi:hypothetical protein
MVRRLRRTIWLTALAAAAGCSALQAPLPGGSADAAVLVPDVPGPPSCELVWAHVYRRGDPRRAVFLFEGNADLAELGEFYQRQMPREGWDFLEMSQTTDTVFRYRKTRGTTEYCDVVIGPSNLFGNRCVVVTVTGVPTQ